MGLLWATPFQLGPMKSPVWWSLSTQGLSSQQKGLLFCEDYQLVMDYTHPPLFIRADRHGCMQTYTHSHTYVQPQRHQKYYDTSGHYLTQLCHRKLRCAHTDAHTFLRYTHRRPVSNAFALFIYCPLDSLRMRVKFCLD